MQSVDQRRLWSQRAVKLTSNCLRPTCIKGMSEYAITICPETFKPLTLRAEI